MKRKTESLLCESFFELLKKNPFHKITIQMISASSGVNRQTFYYHYDNIYDLLGKTIEYVFIQMGHLEEDISWDEALSSFLTWMKDNRSVVKNLLNNVTADYLRKAIYPIIGKCMSSTYRPNVIISDIGTQYEEEFLEHFLTIGITQYILEWAQEDFREPEEEVIDHIFFLLKRIYQ